MIKRDRRGRAIFPPKYYSVHSAIGSRMNGIAFRNRNSSQKNTSSVYSGIGINGIVPKERTLILTTSLIHLSLKGWENVLFELGRRRVNPVSASLHIPSRKCLLFSPVIHNNFRVAFARVAPPQSRVHFTSVGVGCRKRTTTWLKEHCFTFPPWYLTTRKSR